MSEVKTIALFSKPNCPISQGPMVLLKNYDIFHTRRTKLRWAEPRQLFDE